MKIKAETEMRLDANKEYYDTYLILYSDGKPQAPILIPTSFSPQALTLLLDKINS